MRRHPGWSPGFLELQSVVRAVRLFERCCMGSDEMMRGEVHLGDDEMWYGSEKPGERLPPRFLTVTPPPCGMLIMMMMMGDLPVLVSSPTMRAGLGRSRRSPTCQILGWKRVGVWKS